MSKFTVAAQLYTVRDFLKTEDQLRGTLEKVKSIGYNSVQVSGMGPMDSQYVKDVANDIGLDICATHIPFDRLKNDFQGVVNQHKLWGCEYVGIGSMPDTYRNSKEGYSQFAKEASKLGRQLLDSGLHLIYHNHNFEFKKFDGITGMDILFNETDAEAFQFEIDTYWVQSGGGDPIAWIKKMQGRMKVVHFKDMVIDKDNKQIMAEVGEGNINWKGVIEACNEIDAQWVAVEQDVCLRDPFSCLETSLINLKGLGCKF